LGEAGIGIYGVGAKRTANFWSNLRGPEENRGPLCDPMAFKKGRKNCLGTLTPFRRRTRLWSFSFTFNGGARV